MFNSPREFQADMIRRIAEHREQAHVAHAAEQAAAAKRKPFDVPPLADQLREHLGDLPASQKARVSIPALVPHLKGRWRKHPHPLYVAKALRKLGYIPTRSYCAADAGRRYWIAPESSVK